MKCEELKAYTHVAEELDAETGKYVLYAYGVDGTRTKIDDTELVYLKSEADKVIAELKENHKKEVEQLLMEIAEQKNEIEKQKRLRDMALASMPNVLKVMKIIQHHKYKRCLAMADMCNAKYDEEDAKVNGCGASWEYISKVMKFWERWSKCWLEIAEKFKETK